VIDLKRVFLLAYFSYLDVIDTACFFKPNLSSIFVERLLRWSLLLVVARSLEKVFMLTVLIHCQQRH